MKSKLFQDEGNKIKVRLIKRGDKYGLSNCETHNETDPLVEFYDPRHFVRRYYLKTILSIKPQQGLCLEGSRYEYLAIEGDCLDSVKKWLKLVEKR
jgi:hypothetical protein